MPPFPLSFVLSHSLTNVCSLTLTHKRIHAYIHIQLMDEFGYSSDPIVIGTRFAFSGRLASTEEGEVGKASGTCTIGSDLNTDFSLCTFYLTLMEKQDKGMIALTGNTDSVGGYLQVTATGGNLRTHSQGTANLAYDPAGNPILYLLIRFSSSSTSSM